MRGIRIMSDVNVERISDQELRDRVQKLRGRFDELRGRL